MSLQELTKASGKLKGPGVRTTDKEIVERRTIVTCRSWEDFETSSHLDGIHALVDVVEFDVDGFFEHFCIAWESSLGEARDDGFGAGGENVEWAGHVNHLVGDHKDAELEGCHDGASVDWWKYKLILDVRLEGVDQ